MPLPPKGDPQRPLHLAVRSTRVLGILFLALGLWGTVPMFLAGMRSARPVSTFGMGVIALSMVFIHFGPGALYLVCSVFLARRRTWAVITAMIIAGVQLAYMLLAFAFGGLALNLFSAPAAPSALVLVAFGVSMLIFLALAQLEYHLSKCFEAIRLAPIEVQRGFDPLPATPLPATPVLANREDADHQNAQSRYRST